MDKKDVTVKEEEWREIEFPDNPEIVYVIYAKKGNQEKPIYVGETGRNIGRLGDYISMNFKATTDFKVGFAIRYLKTKGFHVHIKYKHSKKRQSEETEILQDLTNDFNLLNGLPNYKYKLANKLEEEERIRAFCNKKIISQW